MGTPQPEITMVLVKVVVVAAAVFSRAAAAPRNIKEYIFSSDLCRQREPGIYANAAFEADTELQTKRVKVYRADSISLVRGGGYKYV